MDLISRQAMLDMVNGWTYNFCDPEDDWAAMKDIRELPSAEPERKKGEWIEHNPHKWGLGIVFECSECGEKIECEPSNFCPNCGADMRRGNNGND